MTLDQAVTYKHELSSLFDRAAPTYGNAGTDYFETLAKRLVAGIRFFPGAAVLDVATGRGAVLKACVGAVGPFGTAIGIDFSRAMIEQTAKEFPRELYPQVELHHMDADHLDFADESFDVVVCSFALFFFPDVLATLKGFLRVLKPSGTLALSTWRERDESASLLKSIVSQWGIQTRTTKHNFEDSGYVHHLVETAGFRDFSVVHDELRKMYPTIDAWFDSQWSHSTRCILEQLSKDQICCLRQSLNNQLKPFLTDQGLPVLLRAAYTYATK